MARFGPRSRGDGFCSGMLVGGALGFVYTPCASPILAAVISVSAASDERSLIALAYAAGSALVLLALALGGRRVMERVRQRRARTRVTARHGRSDDHHGPCDRCQSGRQLRPARRKRHPERQPHREPGVLLDAHPAPARNHRPRSEVQARQRVLLVRRLICPRDPHGAAERLPGRAAGRRTVAGTPRQRTRIHRHPALVQHARRRAAEALCSCTGRSCSSTSGPTPASTASAPCPT